MGGKIRLGFIGAGRRARDHMKVARQMEEVSMEAACDVDEGRLWEVKQEFGVRVYRSPEEMLSKERLDAAVISTPVPLHVPQTLLCLRAGVNVLMEKPISLDVREAVSLMREVKRAREIVAVGFQNRYSDTVERAKVEVDEKSLSMLVGHWYWTVPPIPWIRVRTQAGGQVVEQVVHMIDLFRFFGGEVETVYASYTERGRDWEEDKRMGFDNWASYALTLKFRSGAVGSVSSTYALYQELYREIPSITMDLICREKLIRFLGFGEIRVYTRGKQWEAHKSTSNSMERMWRSFVTAVSTGDRSALPTRYEDAFWSTAVSLAANESALTGRPVNVQDFTGL
jgi:predicted dehydrogenase